MEDILHLVVVVVHVMVVQPVLHHKVVVPVVRIALRVRFAFYRT